MLAWLIQENGGMGEVERNSGVTRAHLNRMVRGVESTPKGPREVNLLDAGPTTVTGLLRAFGMSSEKAWEMFGIPLERRATWRSMEEPGASAPAGALSHLELRHLPLLGVVFAPAGHDLVVVIDATAEGGLQVATLGEQPYVYPAEAVPSGARVRGGFAGVSYFSEHSTSRAAQSDGSSGR
ncbi:hypothetical protein [Deinococcus multiflagellatus]|uniref:HTH cro/C1-type domain-containing protein n=2 Tax=Deinococcus multiflagellatus TaxID=1656887 RepID=A0ABW1ZRV0_9DEIO